MWTVIGLILRLRLRSLMYAIKIIIKELVALVENHL